MQQAPTNHQVIFDLGNVLIRWDPRNLYRKIFGTDIQGMEWFLAHVCNAEWNDRLDAGQSFVSAVAERIAKFPDHADLIRAYHERWFETLGEPVAENVAVLSDLKRIGYQVHALTNWSAETFYPAQKLFPFLTWFDGVVVSGEEGLVKPDPRIYQRLLDRYRLTASSAVFIDDVHRNVEAAKGLGIKAIQFNESINLRRELQGLGIPLPG
jgi:2-haloacid dehalogenase